MHCERARAALLEHLDQASASEPGDELRTHLDGCEACAALHRDLMDLEAQVRVWHDLTPPAWNPTPAGWSGAAGSVPASGTGWRALVTQWFPAAASAAALLLAAGVFWGSQSAAPVSVEEPVARAPSAAVEELLAASRQERQEDMQALTALLKAEMDRRSLETEESLKYIISHQIQSQRELDALRERLPGTATDGAPEQY